LDIGYSVLVIGYSPPVVHFLKLNHRGTETQRNPFFTFLLLSFYFCLFTFVFFFRFSIDKTAGSAVKRAFETYAFHFFEKLFKFLIPFS